ncbi:unnamed protein product [Protopolystoma xenopodis]|uniref:Uncharacterized protein n=1 Tax=Protopolystoma xenopodis TaxID=117903 RepID=A0A448XJM0_9PLAT|nr:unnamed protein product [Protopolystoma xenopodis]
MFASLVHHRYRYLLSSFSYTWINLYVSTGSERNLNPKQACLKRREEEKCEEPKPSIAASLALTPGSGPQAPGGLLMSTGCATTVAPVGSSIETCTYPQVTISVSPQTPGHHRSSHQPLPSQSGPTTTGHHPHVQQQQQQLHHSHSHHSHSSTLQHQHQPQQHPLDHQQSRISSSTDGQTPNIASIDHVGGIIGMSAYDVSMHHQPAG